MGAISAVIRQHRARLFIALSAMSLVVVLGTQAWEPRWYLRAELLAHDWHDNAHLKLNADTSRLAIIDIDEASIEAIGAWPWPRAVVAQLARTLFDRYHVKTVGLDIVFPEPADKAGDDALAALARRRPLVLAQAFDFSGRSDAPRIGALGGGLPLTAKQEQQAPPQATGFIGNHPALGGSACTGHITPQPDFDGQVRRIAPLVRFEDTVYPMLAAAMLACGAESKKTVPARAAALTTTMTKKGYMQVPFKVGLQSYTVIPAIAIFSDAIAPDLLKGRHILIGSSALGLGDRVSTPVHPWLPGVMVHAQLLDALLDEQAQAHARHDFGWLAWIWALASIVLLAMLFALTRARIALAALTLLPLVWLLIADRLLLAGHSVPIALPLIGCAVFLAVQAPFEWSKAQSDTDRFITRFRKYLPPVMVDLLVKQRRGADVLKAVRKMITVLFVDLRGYTAMAEEAPPEQIADFTQWVLGALTEEVHRSGGTLDKYMGDALMAFWGAPLDQPDHADRALDCAAGMEAAIARLNLELPQRYPDLAPIKICIGINSGEAVVGELGTPQRSAFTAIGDAVNLASRLQDHAKTTIHTVLIGSGSAAQVRRHTLALLEHAVIRGRRKGDAIYIPAVQASLLDLPQQQTVTDHA